MPDKTSNIRPVTASVILSLQTVFQAQCLGLFVIYPRTEFHMPGSSGPVDVAIKPEGKGQPRRPSLSYSAFYKNSKNLKLAAAAYFSKFSHHISFRGGTRGSVVDWGIILQAGRSRCRFPIR
jgi:hypothetical protein